MDESCHAYNVQMLYAIYTSTHVHTKRQSAITGCNFAFLVQVSAFFLKGQRSACGGPFPVKVNILMQSSASALTMIIWCLIMKPN